MRRRRRSLERRLAHVAGRAEWGVQARFDAERGQRARRAGVAARPAASAEGPGRQFLERRRRQRHEARELAADARAAVPSLYRALARYADDARQRPLVSVDGRPALLLDAAFLVARTRAGAFRHAVRAHTARAAERGLRVRLTGLWPPYSFVAGRL